MGIDVQGKQMSLAEQASKPKQAQTFPNLILAETRNNNNNSNNSNNNNNMNGMNSQKMTQSLLASGSSLATITNISGVAQFNATTGNASSGNQLQQQQQLTQQQQQLLQQSMNQGSLSSVIIVKGSNKGSQQTKKLSPQIAHSQLLQSQQQNLQHQFKISLQNKQEYIRLQQQSNKYNFKIDNSATHSLLPFQLQQNNSQAIEKQEKQQNQQQQLISNPSQTQMKGGVDGSTPMQQPVGEFSANLVHFRQANVVEFQSGIGAHNANFAAHIQKNAKLVYQQNDNRLQQIYQSSIAGNGQNTTQSPGGLSMRGISHLQRISQTREMQKQAQQQQQQQQQMQFQQQEIGEEAEEEEYEEENNDMDKLQQQFTQGMLGSNENFAPSLQQQQLQQKSMLFSYKGNPNNPYNNHHANNLLREKQFYKSSKLPQIQRRSEKMATYSNNGVSQVGMLKQSQSMRASSRETGDRRVTLAQDDLGSAGEDNDVQDSEQMKREHARSAHAAGGVMGQEGEGSNTSNTAAEELLRKAKLLENDEFKGDEEKQKCIRYFRYNFCELLHVIGKKEGYFASLTAKKLIKTYAQIAVSNGISKATVDMINKVKKFMSTKGKYKYRERFNFAHSSQLRAMLYDVKKRLLQLQEKKTLSSNHKQQHQKDQGDDSSDEDQQTSSKNNKQGSLQIWQTDLAKWKKYHRLDPKTKVFIIKGGYQDLRRALLDRGWVENPDRFSPCFDFKWTCKVQDLDYDNLQEFQVVNHFDNNQVFTSKYGLSRNLRNLIHSDNVDVYKFFPRCYDLADLQEFEDFLENFKVTKAESQLYKFRELLLEYKAKEKAAQLSSSEESAKDSCVVDDKLELKIRVCNEIVSRKFIDFFQQIDLIYNQEMLPCVSPEEWEIVCKDTFILDQKRMEQYLDKLRSHPVPKLVSMSQARDKPKNGNSRTENLPLSPVPSNKAIDQIVGNEETKNSEERDNENEVEEKKKQPKDEVKITEQTEQPLQKQQDKQVKEQEKSKTDELLDLCTSTLTRSSERDPQHHLNGHRNIWIVKPNFLSRGRGIKCFNNVDKIMDYVVGKETQFVSQKYIENPLLINNKKFDMRQWVIVQDFCPPRIWFYDECYLRLCSVDHNIDDLNNRFVHLTNNIVQKCNKDGYTDKDDLMWKQEQFVEYLIETEGRDVFYDEIQPKLKQMVIQSLKCCQDQVGARKNSMEFIGYDFMIDSQYQPWLIEINSSPSMEYSTSITKELVQRALEDTVKVVVDFSMAKKSVKKQVDTGGFKLIYTGKEKTNTLKSGKSLQVPINK